jgi:hypothetical protein
MDNFSPHLSTKRDSRVGDWAEANNVELAYVPTNAPSPSAIRSGALATMSSSPRTVHRATWLPPTSLSMA